MAFEVAGDMGAVEIVSCDSMAVYRGLDVAADKPPREHRDAVPHHLIDVVDPHEDFTAVQYRVIAREAIAGITARGKVALLVGGSGLYFRAVVDELEFAPSDPELRRRLEMDDPDELYARLKLADPAIAASIDPRNVRRVVRAVEILEITGRPPTELRGAWDRRQGPYDLIAMGMTWDRDELFRRATERVHAEMDAGLVDEVRRASLHGFSRTAWQALGVKEVLEHLEGRSTLEEAVALNIRHTKAFIRRQLSWFQADPRITWINLSQTGWDVARATIAEEFAAAVRERSRG